MLVASRARQRRLVTGIDILIAEANRVRWNEYTDATDRLQEGDAALQVPAILRSIGGDWNIEDIAEENIEDDIYE
jgi:hypothetical protein